MRRLAGVLAIALAFTITTACGGSDDASEGETQDTAAPVTIAFLRAVPGAAPTEPAFIAELANAGYRKGENLTILAEDPSEGYADAEAAKEAVRGWVDDGATLIVAFSTTGAKAAAEAAPDTNVLFLSNDPKAAGLVENESEPEGRLTGVTFRVPADRTLSLAQRVTGATRVGLAFPPNDPAAGSNRDALQAAATKLGIDLVLAEFTDPAGVEGAIASLAEQGAEALIVSTSPIAARSHEAIAAAATRHRLPAIANTSIVEFSVLSLFPDSDEVGRQLARQAARLFGGASPSAVPVEDPRRFTVTINTKVAADLGITVPEDVLQEAHRVIQ
jgi:putative ABC transport system substrate-binding protein